MDIPWAAVVPVVVLALAWVGYCWVDIARHDVKHLPKWVWAIIVVWQVPIGGIVYLIVGRERGPRRQEAPPPPGDAGALWSLDGSGVGAPVRISTDGLSKHYGATVAVEGVDLVVPAGSVFGLVGPNGAGKTTLLAMLAGMRHPTGGTIDTGVEPGQMAVLPDTPQFDPWLTAREVVDLARALTDPHGPQAQVAAALDEVGLTVDADRAVGGFSRGMLQRLGLATTLVGRPRLLLLDEPAAALDPLGRREVLDIVGRLRGRATVVFSSHILSDVQEVSDSVAIMDRGRLRFQGTLDELLVGRAAPRYLVRLRPPVADIAATLRTRSWVRDLTVEGDDVMIVEVESRDDAERHLAGALADAGARVVSVRPEAPSLEDVVLELIS